MLSNNPYFAKWYTDTMDIYRVEAVQKNSVTVQERRKVNASPVPCRLYSLQKNGPAMADTGARARSEEKLACDLTVDLKQGDELMVVRGGNLGYANQPERYFAGTAWGYYDPVGGAMSGLQHQEVGLLRDEIVR